MASPGEARQISDDPTFISLFAGIGGADLGFERAGFRCVAQVEIDRYRRAVLERHWPDVPRFDDVREVGAHNLPRADVIVGGFPCQDLSTSGKRRGLAGERSGLFYELSRVIDECSPDWFCIENVPGLLSSQRGEDFALVLGELTGFWPQVPDRWRTAGVCCGPKRNLAWRVLDSRFFGVAQRRRRVYIVGGPRIASGFKVLFEPEGGERNSTTRRAPWEKVAATLTRSFDDGGDIDGQLITGTLPASRAGTGFASRESEDKFLITGPLLGSGAGTSRPSGLPQESEMLVCPPTDPDGVREVTSFPGRVDVPLWEESRKVCSCADSPRYASLGDAMTVNVMEWIARRMREEME